MNDLADKEIDALLRTGLYSNRNELLADAIRNLLLNNQDLRLEMALQMFQTGEVSLGRAAEIAGCDRWQLQDILCKRKIPIVIKADESDAMDKDITNFFSNH